MSMHKCIGPLRHVAQLTDRFFVMTAVSTWSGHEVFGASPKRGEVKSTERLGNTQGECRVGREQLAQQFDGLRGG
jgi:hypothetical protein